MGASPLTSSFLCAGSGSKLTRRSAYLSDVLMSLNLLPKVVPRVFTAAMMASEIPAAMRPYSIAVAPDSSLAKRVRSLVIGNPLLGKISPRAMRGGSSNVLVGNFWEVYLAAIILHRFGQRAAIGRWSACSLNDPKITFGETRAIGVSHILVDCVNCARYKAVSADRWPDDARLSGLEAPFRLHCCRRRRAAMRT